MFKSKKIKNQRGFSLVEMIVAMFIFSVIMVAVTGFFSTSTANYRSARATQRNMEDAQYAMNLMAKSLRTSSIFACSANNGGSWVACNSSGTQYSGVGIYDYSQSKCVRYFFNGQTIMTSSATSTDVVDPVAGCAGAAWGTDQSMIAATGLVNNANFFVIPSATSVLGRVTVSLEICVADAAGTACSTREKDKVRIQSSMSLRDYQEAGL